MRSVPQAGQGPWVRMAVVKQVPQILPSDQLARSLPAAREHLSQVNAPAVGAAPPDGARGDLSRHRGSRGRVWPDCLVQIDDVGVGGDLADFRIRRRDGDQVFGYRR
jgi:hypothetical protein